MKKTVLEKVPSHATVDEVEGMVKKHSASGAVNVFYDVGSHSVVSLGEEKTTDTTLDAKDVENFLDQNAKTVVKALEAVSSEEDLKLLLEAEEAGRNRKKVVQAIEEKL